MEQRYYKSWYYSNAKRQSSTIKRKLKKKLHWLFIHLFLEVDQKLPYKYLNCLQVWYNQYLSNNTMSENAKHQILCQAVWGSEGATLGLKG